MNNRNNLFEFLKSNKVRQDLQDLDNLNSRQEKNKKRFLNEIRNRKQHRKKLIIAKTIKFSMSIVASIILFSVILSVIKNGNEKEMIAINDTPIYSDNIKADSVQDIKLILSDGKVLSLNGNTNKNNSSLYFDIKQDDKSIDYSSKRIVKTNNNEVSNKSEILKYNTLVVPKGKIYNITLSDGTYVTINSDSKLIFPVKFGKQTREVELIGEAYFKVKKDSNRPFIVKGGNINTQVLGTEFNIKAYPEENRNMVTLVSGKVAVNIKDDNYSEILSPGEMISYDISTKTSHICEVNVEDVISWVDGYMVFIHEDIENILNKISRRYNVNIKCEIDYPITFYHRSGIYETADDILKILQMSGKIIYIKNDENSYIVKSK